MTYSIASKKCPLPLLSLCHTSSLSLNEIIKNQVLNKVVCSMMKNFNATLMFNIYNKYKEGTIFLLNTVACRPTAR
jgi:hypothetical protein